MLASHSGHPTRVKLECMDNLHRRAWIVDLAAFQWPIDMNALNRTMTKHDISLWTASASRVGPLCAAPAIRPRGGPFMPETDFEHSLQLAREQESLASLAKYLAHLRYQLATARKELADEILAEPDALRTQVVVIGEDLSQFNFAFTLSFLRESPFDDSLLPASVASRAIRIRRSVTKFFHELGEALTVDPAALNSTGNPTKDVCLEDRTQVACKKSLEHAVEMIDVFSKWLVEQTDEVEQQWLVGQQRLESIVEASAEHAE